MLTHRSTVQVRYAETDMMGIVYHANYLPWFEIARTDLFRRHGLPYRDLEAEGFLLPVLEANVRYLKPARYDDTLAIVATLAEKPSLRMRLAYEVRRADGTSGTDGERLATGWTTHAFIDRSGKPVRPPARFVARMNELFAGLTTNPLLTAKGR
ncbi:MAG: acyl-CoA thioesterase [Opitutaceae bacterium]|nr:acyl-CoA thioesterase [Opitutaceae bacterium]